MRWMLFAILLISDMARAQGLIVSIIDGNAPGIELNKRDLEDEPESSPEEITVGTYMLVGMEFARDINFPGYYDSFGMITLTGTEGITKQSDSCSGILIGPGQSCIIWIRLEPPGAGLETAILTIPYTTTTPDDVTTGVLTRKFEAVGIIPDLADDDSDPPPQKKQLCKNGSIVRLDSQSLGEAIPIVGTDFYLTYSSEFASAYQTIYRAPRRLSFFRPHGWGLDKNHYYDQSQFRLFMGDGSTEFRKDIRIVGSERWLASSDSSEVFVFGMNGRHLRTLHGLTGAIKYNFGYDGQDRLALVTDGYGNQTSFSYASNSYSITSYGLKTTNVNVNSAGLISAVVNPNNESFLMTYKLGTDLLESFTKPGGETSTFTYSARGRLTKDESVAGNKWDLSEILQNDRRVLNMSSKLARSQNSSFRHENGVSIREFSNEFGYVVQTSSALNGTFELESKPEYSDYRLRGVDERFGSRNYDSLVQRTIGTMQRAAINNRVYDPSQPTDFFDFISVTDTSSVNWKTTTKIYTTSDKTAVITSPEGASLTEVINNFEDIVSSKSGNDVPWTYTYDSRGRVSTISQGLFNSVTNTYNSSGFLSSSTNSRNETTSYVYDQVGRLTQTIRPDSTYINYSYDSNGQLIGIVPPGRSMHEFEFNAMELISKYEPPPLAGVAVSETQYNYNLDKQLVSIIRPDTQSVLYSYGAATGLLNKISLTRGDNDYFYVANSDLVNRIDSADGLRNEYTYFGRELKSVAQKRTSDNFLFADFNYIFDDEHRKIYRAIRGGSYPAYAYIGYAYNNDDVPTLIGSMSLTYSYPSGRLATTSLNRILDSRTYDSLGNLESYTAYYNPANGPQQVLYSYTLTRDVMSRIVGKSETIQGVTSVYEYSYDLVGRLTAVVKDSLPYSSYVYDDNGNRTSGVVNGVPFTATYDAQDRLLTYNGRAYTYNANGDNTHVQWSPGVSSSFEYDALGKLISSVSTSGVNFGYSMDGEGNIVRFSQNGTTMVRYIYEDPYRIAGEFTDLGQMYRQYVYGTSVNTPDYTIDASGNNRFIKDHLGSPRLIVRASDGVVMQRMDYDEFGKVIVNTNPTYQPYGFAGGIYLRNTGLVKFGARYYDAEVGRWTTKDPIRFDGGDTNLYGYVGSDPINFFDFSGENRVKLKHVLMPDSAGSGGGGVSSGGTIYVSPKGTAVVASPGAKVGPANNQAGLKIQEAGSSGGANTVRIMDPTSKYPNGYIRIQNKGGQYLDKDGNVVSKKDPKGHICEEE